MPSVLEKKRKGAKPTVIEEYDVAADAKRRVSLRRARAKYYRVRALSDGSYLLEPRMLVPLQSISARTLRMLDRSAENLKKGVASPAIDLTPFRED
jgi:hypothetical protein